MADYSWIHDPSEWAFGDTPKIKAKTAPAPTQDSQGPITHALSVMGEQALHALSNTIGFAGDVGADVVSLARGGMHGNPIENVKHLSVPGMGPVSQKVNKSFDTAEQEYAHNDAPVARNAPERYLGAGSNMIANTLVGGGLDESGRAVLSGALSGVAGQGAQDAFPNSPAAQIMAMIAGGLTPAAAEMAMKRAPAQVSKALERWNAPVQGRVSSGFGEREAPKAGASTFHQGIDIAVPVGTPVRAPAQGVIEHVGHGDPKRGNWAEIRHPDGTLTRYMHLSEIDAKPGQIVEQGTAFAKSGATGNVTGPHLHWSAVDAQGRPFDPRKLEGHPIAAEHPPLKTENEERNPDEHLDLNDDLFISEINRRTKADPNYEPTPAEGERIQEMVKEDPSRLYDFEAINRGTPETNGLSLQELADKADNDPIHMKNHEVYMNGELSDEQYRQSYRAAMDRARGREPSNIVDIEDARHSRDAMKAYDAVNELHGKVADLHDSVINEESTVNPAEAENTRALINRELNNFRPGSVEHDKLLHADDMLKAAIAHSGGKPRIYAPDASERYLSGEPKTDAANNRFPVYEARKPGKTLHEYTDQELQSLSPADKKYLVDEQNHRQFPDQFPKPELPHGRHPVYDAPVKGKALHEYTDVELKQLSPEDRHNLAVEQNRRQFPENYPDRGEPAASSSFGTKPQGPSHRANKPENELKAPEGHDSEREPPELKKQKKLLLDKLGDAIDQGTPLRREVEAAISAERSRRLAAAFKAQRETGGREGLYKALAAMKGEMERPKIASINHWFTPEEIDQMHDIIWKSPALEGFEHLNASRALDKLLHEDYGLIPTPNEVLLLAKAMPRQASVWKRLLENEEGSLTLPDGNIKKGIINVAGLPRTLKASFDFSAPFRQGIFLVGRKEFWKAMPDMFKSFFSQKHFEHVQEEIASRPTYHLMNKAGLQTTKLTGNMVDREEAFISQFAEKIPGVRHSERAYIAFLNKLRADVFDDFVKKGERLGIDQVQNPEYLKSAAKFINTATGRGSFGALGRDASVMSNVLFSPKLMASRLQLFGPGSFKFYGEMHPAVRAEAAKSGLILASAVVSILGLAAAAGAKVMADPRSSDFAKIKIGNTRIDVTGGFQPYVRFYAQFLTGQQIGINDNVVRNVGTTFAFLRKMLPGEDQPAFKPTTRKDLVYRFGEQKEAPNMNEATRLLQESDPVGNPLGTNTNPIADAMYAATGKSSRVGNEAVDMVTPLILSDTYSAYKDLGAKGLLTAIPAAMGVGVQTYTPKIKKEKKEAAKKNDFGISDSDFNFGPPSKVDDNDFKF